MGNVNDEALAASLRDFARVVQDIPDDALLSRWSCLHERIVSEAHRGGYVPSLDAAAGFKLTEPRHTVVLAWMLDPRRSGQIAGLLWPHVFRARTPDSGISDPAPAWSPGLLVGLDVAPETHGAEAERRDVWAHRLSPGGTLDFGVVIEAKINAPERQHQCRDHVEGITGQFGSASLDKVLFIFLSKEGRRPVSTGDATRSRWRVLSWRSLADAVQTVAAAAELSVAEQVLLSQYYHAIQRSIFGEDTGQAARSRYAEIMASYPERLPAGGFQRAAILGELASLRSMILKGRGR